MCHSCLRRSGVLRQDTARASQYLVRGADYLMDSQPLEHEIIETSYRGHNSCLSVGQKKLDFLPFFFSLPSKSFLVLLSILVVIHAKSTEKHGACLVFDR